MCLESELRNSSLCLIYNIIFFSHTLSRITTMNHSWSAIYLLRWFLFPKHLFYLSSLRFPGYTFLCIPSSKVCLVKVVSKWDIDCRGILQANSQFLQGLAGSIMRHSCWLGSKGKENHLNKTLVTTPGSTRLSCLFPYCVLFCAKGGKSEKWQYIRKVLPKEISSPCSQSTTT